MIIGGHGFCNQLYCYPISEYSCQPWYRLIMSNSRYSKHAYYIVSRTYRSKYQCYYGKRLEIYMDIMCQNGWFIPFNISALSFSNIAINKCIIPIATIPLISLLPDRMLILTHLGFPTKPSNGCQNIRQKCLSLKYENQTSPLHLYRL